MYSPEVKQRAIELLNLNHNYTTIIDTLKKEGLIIDEIPSRSVIFLWRRMGINVRELRNEQKEEIVKKADENTERLLEEAEKQINLASKVAATCADFSRVAARFTNLAVVWATIEGKTIQNIRAKVEAEHSFEDPAIILMNRYPRSRRYKKTKGGKT